TLMRDHPGTVHLAQANGRPHPHVNFPSACPRSADPVEVMAEGHRIARRDAQVANLVADRALIQREPGIVQILLIYGGFPLDTFASIERNTSNQVVATDTIRSHSRGEGPPRTPARNRCRLKYTAQR